MQRHPSLHQLLVAPPQQLAPQQPHGQMVAMPHAPPAQLPYGSIPPGIAQSQRFTGGIAQHQPMSQMFSPPDYTPPSLTGGYGGSNMGGVNPLAALAAALGIGLSSPPGLPPRPPGATSPGGRLGPVPSGVLGDSGQRGVGSGYLGKGGVPVLPGPQRNPASGGGYLTQGGAPTPAPGRSTGGGYLGQTGTPQTGLAATLASVGKRGVYNV